MYLDLAEWLPIHEAYEAERPSYFATPPVHLIAALDVSLGQLLEEGVTQRIARHEHVASTLHAAWQSMGLAHLAENAAHRAHTLSALHYPAGIDASLVAAVAEQGVVIAGGLLPALKTKYFRVGHMGAVNANDVAAVTSAIRTALSSRRGA
jgi:alanine-glyoxylate transaminase/serine-glyoxylate transaminase/serine-pyruvate transaminase